MHWPVTVRGAVGLAMLLVLLMLVSRPAHAQTEAVLYSFGNQLGDGAAPSGLIMDKEGNFYGTTQLGGTGVAVDCGGFGCGTVFKLTSTGEESVLYSLGSNSGDGVNPWAGLIMDNKANLYGTTSNGGASSLGTVFTLTSGDEESVLYSFAGSPNDGASPYAGLIRDKERNLYGTTLQGGAYGNGTVFKLSPPRKKGGAWTETVLYNFEGPPRDGANPYAGLVMDITGNLYGTTSNGGANRCGTVFKMIPTGGETLLYSFGNQSGDGCYPVGTLILDKQGNLYGTTALPGTVFKLTSSGEETVLYSFCSQPSCTDGTQPSAGLAMDRKGNLYGTTQYGGANNLGTVFKLTSHGEETVLHSFGSQSGDGYYPFAGLVMDKQGNLYGSTLDGGAEQNGCFVASLGCGTVFKVTP